MTRTQSHPMVYLGVAAVWLAAVIVLAATGQIATLHPPVPQVVVVALTAALIIAGAALPGFRVWLAGLNLRQIVAFHVTRFVGIYFLVLYSRGELPFDFAVKAGIGDIVVATGAVVLVLFVPNLIAHRGAMLGWNVLGLADILFAVATAVQLAMANPGSMGALVRLPLAVVPMFLVPLIIGSHVLLFFRLRREPEKS